MPWSEQTRSLGNTRSDYTSLIIASGQIYLPSVRSWEVCSSLGWSTWSTGMEVTFLLQPSRSCGTGHKPAFHSQESQANPRGKLRVIPINAAALSVSPRLQRPAWITPFPSPSPYPPHHVPTALQSPVPPTLPRPHIPDLPAVLPASQ